MTSTSKAAQEADANGVLNRDTPAANPRPTAKGEQRIPKGDAFMGDWKIPQMKEHMKSLKDGKEVLVVLACIKNTRPSAA